MNHLKIVLTDLLDCAWSRCAVLGVADGNRVAGLTPARIRFRCRSPSRAPSLESVLSVNCRLGLSSVTVPSSAFSEIIST